MEGAGPSSFDYRSNALAGELHEGKISTLGTAGPSNVADLRLRWWMI